MKRAQVLYFGFLAAAVALFAVAALMTFGGDGTAWSAGAVRFLVLALAAGCAIATWGTAVMIASVHKVAWPLFLTVGIVVCAGLVFAVICAQA